MKNCYKSSVNFLRLLERLQVENISQRYAKFLVNRARKIINECMRGSWMFLIEANDIIMALEAIETIAAVIEAYKKGYLSFDEGFIERENKYMQTFLNKAIVNLRAINQGIAI